MRACHPGPASPCSADTLVAAAQSKPDHAPTSRGSKRDLLPSAVPAAHARLSLKTRTSHGSSAICRPS